ncbi:MAG: NAD+ synthase [Thermoleophilia bacterium]|nr:NAD+ synthase [Thermoleophilia bacterium]
MVLLALCQLNPTVGAIDANAALVRDCVRAAAAAGADLAVTPELALTGYPPEDLLYKPHLVQRAWAALEALAPELEAPALVGLPIAEDGVLYNAAAYVRDGRIAAIYRKRHLPNYGVFDEHRWFAAGREPLVIEVPTHTGADVRVGVTICEDVWVEGGPIVDTTALGVDLVVNLSASPWRLGRGGERCDLVARRARESGTWLALCNQVGGQDELVFDGRSVVAAPDGELVAVAEPFNSDLLLVEVGAGAPPLDAAARALVAARVDDAEVERDVWSALVLGLRDYVGKNGFSDVVFGLSGGIDSGLVAALAVDALGAEHVRAVTMPSRHSSAGTLGDAHGQAALLGIEIVELPVQGLVNEFEAALAHQFAGRERDVTEENLQARVRGTLLMALSNKFGQLVLATGNKSEYSVGYATLYGDMNGGFAPLKDVPKTLVFRLARWRNAQAAAVGAGERVPQTVIDRPPTAELRDDQLDSDSLPDYDLLDAVLVALVDGDRSVEETVAMGFERAVVERTAVMLDRAEYKRRQAPPGVRVTSKAFGRDRRVPITNGFDGRSVAIGTGASGDGEGDL